MITETERKRIIDLIHQEVVPAIGCTEPIAVALCVAKATETLGTKPEKINVLLSANILKNAMGVGIPGTGMIGLPIAIALGALIGKSEYQLEVLKDSTPDVVEEGKRFIEEKRIHISLKENIEEKLYIEVCCEVGDDKATAVIAGGHTTFIYIERNGEVLFQKQHTASCEKEEECLELTLRKVYDFALNTPLDEISFILEAEPGDYITVARKAKVTDNWFVGGITDENPRTSAFTLDFLEPGKQYVATLYADGKEADFEKNPTSYQIKKGLVTNKNKMSVKLARSGGFAVSLIEATPADLKTIKKWK